MKNITVKYNRLDFFGRLTYTEDTKADPSFEDVKRAFLFLGKDNNYTVQLDDCIYCWDSIAEFNNKVVTVIKYEAWNSSDCEKIAFQKVKSEIYNSFK
jgi:hypothetical protein